MNKPYFCRDFFYHRWRDKCLRNTIDLLLFYGEHFYGFLESDFSKVKIYKMAEATLILGNRFF